MIATGADYLRFVGPTYGFFGMGLALYFASQGAGKLAWPLIAGFARLVIAVGGGWLALAATGKVRVVTETYRLDEIGKAYERVEKGQVRFRAVVTM